jgi:IclR family mhp operon transcriptional activator
LLQRLNEVGTARPAALAQSVRLDRTTTYRLLATLEAMGLVRRSESSDDYVLTDGVRTLSDGFTARDRTTQIVAAHMGTLFPQVLWPTDFATFENGAMVIRETTHRFSPYSVHRAMVGRPRPLLVSALGRAALAGATDAQREAMLDILAGSAETGAVSRARMNDEVNFIISDFGRRGYAWSVGGTDSKISAIAVPVKTRSDIAALNLIFFSSAMGVEKAAERFLEPLKACARDVERDLADLSATPDE